MNGFFFFFTKFHHQFVMSINLTFLASHLLLSCFFFNNGILLYKNLERLYISRKIRMSFRIKVMEIMLLLFFIFSTIYELTSAELCFQIMSNKDEYIGAIRFPARIRTWNSATQNFELLEALVNGTLVCSVDNVLNVQGKTIEVAVDAIHPYVLPNPSYTYVTGYIGDIWNVLESTLKFTTVFKKAGPSAGHDLLYGLSDVWLAATAIHVYSSGHYSYTHQIARTSYSLFAMSEGTHVSNYWYAKIFSKNLWLMTFSFVFGVALLLFVMYQVKKVLCRDYNEYYDEFAGFSFILIYVLGGVTGQGIQTIPSSWALRVLIVTALLMGALISCGFNSTLTSFLAIRGRRVPLTNLEDIVEKRTHSLCVRNDSGAYYNLTTSIVVGSPLRAEWKGIVNTKRCPDMKDTRTLGGKLCNPGVVFVEAPDVFLSVYRQVQHQCEIVQIPGDYWPLKISFLFARASPYRLIINRYLLRLHSAGILRYLERKWISRELPDSTDHKFSFKPVESAHIQFIFLGFCLFIPISALICIIENIYYRLTIRIETTRKIKHRKKVLNQLMIAGFPIENKFYRHKVVMVRE